MFKRIYNYFGYSLVKKEDHDKMSEVMLSSAQRALEIDSLKQRLEGAFAVINSFKNKGFVVDSFMGDPSPVDREQRGLYVARVAGLHKDILGPKLKHMISTSLKLLEDSTNDREYDQAVKGAIYSLRELIRWGDAMVNEQLSYQTENRVEE